MVFSSGTLSRIAILWCPLVEAIRSGPVPDRAGLNATIVTKITSTYEYLSLAAGTHSYTENYFSSHSRSVSRPTMTLYDTSLDSNGNPVMYTTWYILPSNISTVVAATTTSLAPKPGKVNWNHLPPISSPPTATGPPSADFTPSTLILHGPPNLPKFITYHVPTDLPPTCSTLSPGEPLTVWSIVPNTTTVTVTVTGNYSTTLLPTPEFTPPVYCPGPEPIEIGGQPFFGTAKPTNTKPKDSTDSAVASSSTPYGPEPTRNTITVITTSKNAVTVTTKATLPTFPGGDPPDKQTVDPGTYTDTHQWGPLKAPPPTQNPPIDVTTIINAGHDATTPVTFVRDSFTVVVSPSQAVIGGQVVNIGSPPTTITEGGGVYTVGPDTVEGPLLQILVPNYPGNGGRHEEPPKTTTIQDVPIQVRPSEVVIGGNGGGTTTVPLMPGATPTTIVVKGQTISVGPGGIGFSGTTITPPPSMPTNVVVVGGQGFSAIGNTVAVIGGTSFAYGPGIEPKTVVLNGQAITVGPQGVVFDGTTIGGPSRTAGVQYAVAGGLSISEIGSTLAVINGVTLTLGQGATPMTTVIGGQSITVGPDSLVVGGATLTLPFNPPTQTVTAGGVTFSQIGASLAVIGDKTYTFGPGAQQTSTVIDGQTISIGPGGIGFKTTTFTGTTSIPTQTSTATSTGKKKSGAERLGNELGVLGIWIAIWTTMALGWFMWV